MQNPRFRLTVFRLVLLIAVVAIVAHLATGPLRNRVKERRERCLELAAAHASLAAEYRQNARYDEGMLKLSAWHEYMRDEFNRAAHDPEMPRPQSQPFPPSDWVAPTKGKILSN